MRPGRPYDRCAVTILLSFVIALALNGAFFAIAAVRKTDVVTDLSYSLTFAVLAVFLPFPGAREPVQLVASLLVVIWAARLGRTCSGGSCASRSTTASTKCATSRSVSLVSGSCRRSRSP